MSARSLLFFGAGLAAVTSGRALLRWGIRASLAPRRVPHHLTPAALGLAFERVRIPTANARSLHAWLIPAAVPGGEGETECRRCPAVIIVHGWGGNAAVMLPLARPLHDAGFTTLFIDARCHGASDDDSFASLPRFAEDAEHAFDWLASLPQIDPRRIALLGHSVGAGAAMLAALRRPGVAAVVSVAAFAHPAAMMRRWLAARHIPERPLGRYILDYVQQTIGHRFDDIAPINTIGRVRCPVLLVHGEDDEVVPIDEARQILAARRDAAIELLVLSGDHESFADLERHMEHLIGFLHAASIHARDGPRSIHGHGASAPRTR